MLRVKNVGKKFGGLTALHDVTFDVPKGSIVGLIGPNGSGKTTCFNVVSGIMPATFGTVHLNELDITHKKAHEISQLGLARTFQIVKPFLHISVLDNVRVGSFQRFKKNHEATEKAYEVLQMLGLKDCSYQLPGNLTLGQKKKLEIARALATNPSVLLLDEVMGGLNPKESEQLLETIKEINSWGITIMIIEHKMKAIMSLAEKIIVLNNGAKIVEGKPEEVVRNSQVIKAYLGENYHAKSE
jgi:branched-chain amino acid transport system ATP-binding protein